MSDIHEFIAFSDIASLMDAWAGRHVAENPGHRVWVHRRKFDMALACFTCLDNTKKPLECQHLMVQTANGPRCHYCGQPPVCPPHCGVGNTAEGLHLRECPWY